MGYLIICRCGGRSKADRDGSNCYTSDFIVKRADLKVDDHASSAARGS